VLFTPKISEIPSYCNYSRSPRELKGGPRFTGWRLFLVSLIVFTVIDYFYLRRWG
jgi:hypothetical protein